MNNLFDNPSKNSGTRFQPGHGRKNYVYDKENYIRKNGTLDREKLLKDARRVAKANNQRLLRLEKENLTNAPAYRGAVKALSGAYSKADKVAFGHVDKNGRPRYKERVDSLTNDELLQLLYAGAKTQQAKTSTPAMAHAMYDKGLERMNTMLKERADFSVTLNDLFFIFKDEALTNYNKLFGYQAVIQMVSDVRNKDKSDEEDEDIEKIRNQIDDAAKKLGKKLNLAKLRKKLGITKTRINPDKWVKAT